MRDRLREAGVEHEFVACPAGGHGLDGRWPDVHARMLAWFDRPLRG